MMPSYFDSSVLLTILLDEDRQKEAHELWQDTIRFSSILLKIEALIALRRTYEANKNKLENNWLRKNTVILEEYLNEVNYMLVNGQIEREIYLRRELSQCRSIDAIHIATALQFREINDNEAINLFTFDKTMSNLAKNYGFITNRI